jgi:hypothetical protein
MTSVISVLLMIYIKFKKSYYECDICINYNKHIENFTDSRNSMHSHSSYAKNESNLIVVTLDAQKTLNTSSSFRNRELF